MKRFVLFAAALGLLAFFAYSLAQNQPQRPAAAVPAARTALRITFGERQDRETDYSGSLTLTEGRVTELIPWRFFGDDRLDGPNGWKLLPAPLQHGEPARPAAAALHHRGKPEHRAQRRVGGAGRARHRDGHHSDRARRLHVPHRGPARWPRGGLRRRRCHRAGRAGARPHHPGAPARGDCRARLSLAGDRRRRTGVDRLAGLRKRRRPRAGGAFHGGWLVRSRAADSGGPGHLPHRHRAGRARPRVGGLVATRRRSLEPDGPHQRRLRLERAAQAHQRQRAELLPQTGARSRRQPAPGLGGPPRTPNRT